MASLDLEDLPPKIARLILGLSDGEALLLVQNGAVMGRLIAQTAPPPTETPEPAAPEAPPKMMRAPVPAAERPPEPAPPISSPAVERQTRDIFESFRASIEDEF